MATRTMDDENTVSETVTVTEEKENLVLKLRKPKTDKEVKWKEGVIDNEFMGKKTSKCCCIYSAPHVFGESSDESSSDGDDCCHEFKSARKKLKKKKVPSHDQQPDCPH